MGFIGGTFLKLTQTVLYAVIFCASAVVLGIYSYFLAWLASQDMSIPAWEKAVEGLAGSSCLYLIFAVLLTCFLGGKSFFAFLGIAFDLLFCGAMIAIAVMTRDGVHSCSRSDYVETPVGDGRGSVDLEDGPHLSYMCLLNKTAFAVSIIAAGLYVISAVLQLFIARNHRKEKRYGPSPRNNYTSGSGVKWFRRRRGPRTTHDAYAAKDAEVAGAQGGLAAPAHDIRPSHDTAYTGTTMGNTNAYEGDKYAPAMPSQGGYHTAPVGSSVNPYGYDNNARPNNF